MHPSLLDKKVVLITGGAGDGIGHGLTTVCAEHGATVVIAERDQPRMEALAARLRGEGRAADAVACDITQGAQVEQAVRWTLDRFGRIDGLVNSAGIGLIQPLGTCSDADYERLTKVDLYGTFAFCRAVIPVMQRQKSGAIVNIASVHAERTSENYGLYAAVKAGVAGLTRGLAVQYGPDGIRANVILPGLVDGDQTRRLVAEFAENVQNWIEDFAVRKQAMPHLIQPRDVGEAAAFLLSDRAASITGVSLAVDAGLLALLSSRDPRL